jgi:hypothetical protein
LKQGFFEGIKSFKEFEARTGKLADTVERAEHGVRPYLSEGVTKYAEKMRF